MSEVDFDPWASSVESTEGDCDSEGNIITTQLPEHIMEKWFGQAQLLSNAQIQRDEMRATVLAQDFILADVETFVQQAIEKQETFILFAYSSDASRVLSYEYVKAEGGGRRRVLKSAEEILMERAIVATSDSYRAVIVDGRSGEEKNTGSSERDSYTAPTTRHNIRPRPPRCPPDRHTVRGRM